MVSFEERKINLKTHNDLSKLKEGQHYYLVKQSGIENFCNNIKRLNVNNDFDIKVDFNIKHLFLYAGTELNLNVGLEQNSMSIVFSSMTNNEIIKINLSLLGEYGIYELEENKLKEKLEEAASFVTPQVNETKPPLEQKNKTSQQVNELDKKLLKILMSDVEKQKEKFKEKLNGY
jgi:hypothetical protein